LLSKGRKSPVQQVSSEIVIQEVEEPTDSISERQTNTKSIKNQKEKFTLGLTTKEMDKMITIKSNKTTPIKKKTLTIEMKKEESEKSFVLNLKSKNRSPRSLFSNKDSSPVKINPI
jgi:hypothetical protein